MLVAITLVTSIARHFRGPFILEQLQRRWKILDLGCGDGWLTRYLNENGFNVTGADIKLRNELPNIIVSDAGKLPFKDDSFDCIVMVEVVEHISPRNAYREIRRTLKPNGKLIVTTPHPKFEWFIEMLKALRLVKYHDSPHINTTYIEDLPFNMVRKTKMFLVDQVGIYVNKK